MELIVGLIALVFGIRLIGMDFQAIFALIGLIFRFWLVSVAFGFSLVIVGSIGGNHSDHQALALQVQQHETSKPQPLAEPIKKQNTERIKIESAEPRITLVFAL